MYMKWKNWTVIITFFIFLIFPFILRMTGAGQMDDETAARLENRDLAEKPAFSFSNIESFHTEYEDYLNDHVPYRYVLVGGYSRMMLDAFHTPIDTEVVLGKNGWLFYQNIDDGDSIGTYLGDNLYSEEELKNIAERLEKSAHNLRKKGITFVLFLIPNKERIYVEYMPEYLGEPAETYRAKQLVEYLRENTDVKVVYPYEELYALAHEDSLEPQNLFAGSDSNVSNEKSESTTGADKVGNTTDGFEKNKNFTARMIHKGISAPLLYRMTDTHWNKLGAYVGARELLAALKVSIPAATDSGLNIATSRDEPGDLTSLLNLRNTINPGPTFSIFGYPTPNMKQEEFDSQTYFRYSSSASDKRTIFIRRDSFCEAMAEVIGGSFRKSVMAHADIFNNSLIETEAPDIFIFETAERRMNSIETFQYP